MMYPALILQQSVPMEATGTGNMLPVLVICNQAGRGDRCDRRSVIGFLLEQNRMTGSPSKRESVHVFRSDPLLPLFVKLLI